MRLDRKPRLFMLNADWFAAQLHRIGRGQALDGRRLAWALILPHWRAFVDAGADDPNRRGCGLAFEITYGNGTVAWADRRSARH